MRYTTIIDLREWPQAYKNANVCLVYLHLCLVAGYHDYNRDVTEVSIRSLSADTGVSVSAVRHALKVLEKLQLIRRKGRSTYVRKWIAEKKPSPRKPATQSGVVTETVTAPKVNGLKQLQERAAAGDLRAREIIENMKKYKKNEEDTN